VSLAGFVDARPEVAGGLTYEVVSDGVSVFSALVFGVIDDDLGLPLGPGLALVDVDPPGLRAWTGDAGAWGFAADPARIWSDLSVPHVVTFTAQAPGYRPRPVVVPIPAHAVFPVTAAPTSMRRLPMRLQGHVRDALSQAPLAGATITLTPGPAPHPLLLRTPLAAAHDAAAVQGVTLLPAALAPPLRVLASDAEAGDTQLVVNDTGGFAPGQLLPLGPAPALRWAQVKSIGPAPGVLVLTGPLMGRAPATTPVEAFTATPSGAIGALARRAEAGEAVLLLSALPAGDVLRVQDTPRPDEFFSRGALADASGRWAATGVAAPARPSLQPAAAGHATPPPTVHALDFQRPVDVIDFELGP
jgi:hypothetical protein